MVIVSIPGFVSLRSSSLKPCTGEGEICILYWKLGLLSKHYLALPTTGIQIGRFFSPFFLSLFYCNIFLSGMHTYKYFPKRMASLLQCLAKRHELQGRIGARCQGTTCMARHPNSWPLSCVCHSGPLCLPFWDEFPAPERYWDAEMAKVKCTYVEMLAVC